jgi:membrane protease YdiL (CAAX protease family)
MPEPEAAPPQAEAVPQPGNAPIAPVWHTVLIIAVLLLFSLGGAHSQVQAVQRHGRISLYLSTILFEWTLVTIIWLGLRARGVRLRELIGGKWSTPEDLLLDVAIAVVYLFVADMLLAVLKLALGLASINQAAQAKQVQQIKDTLGFIVPHGTHEDVAFVLLVISAGFCEELIYRGYLQRALAGLSGSAAVGMVAQAILFGASHGYQGAKNMAVIAVYGFFFGLLAYWRKSLRPGMMAHFVQDFFSVLLLKFFFRL